MCAFKASMLILQTDDPIVATAASSDGSLAVHVHVAAEVV